MIPYELAKKIKDAGFPQNTEFHYIDTNTELPEREFTWSRIECEWGSCRKFENVERVGAPTLSELIEACGEIFCGLHRLVDGKWIAFIFDMEDSTRQVNVRGQSPLEAVLNLWLELNKNDHDK